LLELEFLLEFLLELELEGPEVLKPGEQRS
jgi:hypothetical protein